MRKLDNYLIPYFGEKGLSEITPGLVQEYRIHRQSYSVKRHNQKTEHSGSRPKFNTILEEEGLKYDRDGQARTAYSLRHTYICMRLTEGADIYQVAKNCRTSVEMIEKYYASHIANRIDASAVNVRKTKRPKR